MDQNWESIRDYEVEPEKLADSELRALSEVWIERRSFLEDSDNFSRFTDRLKREWAIETGLIERLYALDRGITELMIEHGINEDLLPHGSGDQSPSRVVAMIDDQKSAIDSVFAFVNGGRELSTSYIKELHGIFTRNQEFVEGRDQFNKVTQVPLVHGDYKQLPNNPTREDGLVHIYCPPIHVSSEMDRLIELHRSHMTAAPEVEAAWLHHRFTQIHPFQDGNGRVARALATLIFLKAHWLPLVVRDIDRKKYIDALEAADEGDLRPLVLFFSVLQKKEFLKVIGLAQETEQAIKVDQRIDSIKTRLAQRRDALKNEWNAASESARRLHDLARDRFNEVSFSLQSAIRDSDEYSFSVDDELDDGSRGHFYYHQIISTAKKLGYYANTRHYRSWVRLIARDGNRGNILISFHCVGKEFQGVLGCTGTWFLQEQTDDGKSESRMETELTDEVFQINYRERIEDVEVRFRLWLERVIERGLALWETTL